MSYQARLKKEYVEKIVPALQEKLGMKNVNAVPRLEKIVVNIGVGEATQNSKLIEAAFNDLKIVTGQQPVIRKAKKSEAGFKLREGMPIGVSVTLRNSNMYDFLDRLICLALPRTKDFEGISKKAFDGRGNYTLGIKEQLIFPEIEFDKVDKIFGIGVTIVTTAKTDEQSFELLKAFGMPFQK
ncbi:MAG: 50S ribosomal protein L5 [Fusobacteria bacterium]|nr:50S ribosomal protein L5 [Fusobacteriota bacterium]